MAYAKLVGGLWDQKQILIYLYSDYHIDYLLDLLFSGSSKLLYQFLGKKHELEV
jgi:hypothetical protein